MHYITPLLWVTPGAEDTTDQDAYDSMKLGVRVHVPTPERALEILVFLGMPPEQAEQQVHYCMTGEFEASTLGA